MMYALTIMIIIIVLIVLFCLYKKYESFGSSDGGALIQLYAKGPQDVYLTGNVEKYVPEYLYGLYPYGYYLNGEPERYQAEYYPRNGHYPSFNSVYPLLTPTL